MKTPVRRYRMESIDDMDSRTTWRDPELVFVEYDGNIKREVHIVIKHPSDLRMIRANLSAIEKHWRDSLEAFK